MSHACPNGHQSDWEDFCSQCGVSIGAPAADASATAASGPIGGTCANCNNPYQQDDVFCERCGYDFATGSLPEEDDAEAAVSPGPASIAAAAAASQSAPSKPTPSTPSSPAEPAEPTEKSAPEPVAASADTDTDDDAAVDAGISTAVVAVDADYFNRVAAGADLSLPDPIPEPIRIPLTGDMVLIGRHNQKRGVYPEIDIDKLTADPAASTRHAMLRRSGDGSWTINDLGSTNGTLIDDQTDIITPGTELALSPASRVFLGAWTRITFE